MQLAVIFRTSNPKMHCEKTTSESDLNNEASAGPTVLVEGSELSDSHDVLVLRHRCPQLNSIRLYYNDGYRKRIDKCIVAIIRLHFFNTAKWLCAGQAWVKLLPLSIVSGVWRKKYLTHKVGGCLIKTKVNPNMYAVLRTDMTKELVRKFSPVFN